MEKVIREPGNRIRREVAGRLVQIWTRVTLCVGFIGLVLGFQLRGLAPELKLSSWACALTTMALMLLAGAAYKWACGKVEQLLRNENWVKAATEIQPGARQAQEEFPKVAQAVPGLARVDAGATERIGANG